MITHILVPASTNGSLKSLAIVEVKRGNGTIEVVIHLLLVYQCAYSCPVSGDSIFSQCLVIIAIVILILLVIALALGVVKGYVHCQSLRQELVPEQLVMLLMVVICLIVIVMHVAIGIGIHESTRIVGASIKALLIL